MENTASNGKSRRIQLSGTIQIDEFLIGQYEEGKAGRSGDSKKKLVVVALEILIDKGSVGRAYAQVIERASFKEFRPFFEAYINKDAHVITNLWKGYLPLRKDYPNLEQIPSENKKEKACNNCSKDRLQGYLDEYHFRYNRRAMMGSIFDLLIRKMVESEPKRLIKRDISTVV